MKAWNDDDVGMNDEMVIYIRLLSWRLPCNLAFALYIEKLRG
jgi:hypothetical protein